MNQVYTDPKRGPIYMHEYGETNLICCIKHQTNKHFELTDYACENVASDLGLGGGFYGVLQFPLPLTTG